jgi:hypothetical protein
VPLSSATSKLKQPPPSRQATGMYLRAIGSSG